MLTAGPAGRGCVPPGTLVPPEIPPGAGMAVLLELVLALVPVLSMLLPREVPVDVLLVSALLVSVLPVSALVLGRLLVVLPPIVTAPVVLLSDMLPALVEVPLDMELPVVDPFSMLLLVALLKVLLVRLELSMLAPASVPMLARLLRGDPLGAVPLVVAPEFAGMPATPGVGKRSLPRLTLTMISPNCSGSLSRPRASIGRAKDCDRGAGGWPI